MAIQDDFTIYPFSKVIRHNSSGTTVYSVTAFYSWLMDAFDEPAFQSYEAPMKFNTPTSFSMLNGWFLDNGDGSDLLKFLTGGSIDTIDYTTVADPVYMMDIDGEVTEFVAGDLDEEILAQTGGAVGPLLSFKANYPSAGLARFWVRDVNSHGAIIASDNITMTAPGLASYTNTLGPSVNGDEIYTNVFTLASFPGSPNPQPYIYQAHPVSGNGRIRIAEWSGLTNWDKDASGFDILIPTQLGGTEIDGANITTLVRQTGDTYTFVESDLTGGARTPLATETLSDAVNVDEGEFFLLYDASDTGSFTAGDIIQQSSTAPSATPSTWYAEVVSVQEFTDTTTGVLSIRSLDGTIADGDPIYVGTTQEATANGTPGGTFVSWDATTLDPVAGDIGKGFLATGSGARRILRGFQVFTATTSGAMVMDANAGFGTIDTIDYGVAATHDALYIEPLENDSWSGVGTATVTVSISDVAYTGFSNTVLISDFSDITIAHLNGTITVVVTAGTFEVGERLDFSIGGEAIFAGWDTEFTVMQIANMNGTEPGASDTVTGSSSGATANVDSVMTDDNLLNYAFTQQSAAPYSVLIEGGSIYNAARSLKDIYKYCQFYVRAGQNATERVIYTSDGSSITQVAAEEYIKARSTYTATKPAPYGTLAGTLFFGAQGVWVQGTASVDDLRLTDDTGVAQQGTPSVTVTVSNTRVDDVVTVFLEDGSTGLPDKAQFSMPGGEIVSDSTIVVTGAIPVDTPSTGTIYVVDDSFAENAKEHRYRYASWTGSTFTLKTEVVGTNTAGPSDTLITDTGAFANAERGDIIRNTTDPAIGYIVSVTDNDNAVTTQMRDSSGNVVQWATSDGFEMNSVVVAIAAADTAFVPYLDAIEDVGTDGSPGSISDTLLFTTNRAVVIRARNNLAATEIVPFVTTSDITSGGMTVSVIRTEDTVTT
jgi:YD repeat-containing protein